MDEALKLLASLSLSGSLAILALLLCRPLVRSRLSKRWQYYIWLAAVFRLLLPLSPEASPVGALFREAEAGIQTSAVSPPPAEAPPDDPAGGVASGGAPAPAERPDPSQILFPLWLAGALLLLTWKAVSYRDFCRYIRAGCREVSDPALLDQLAEAGALAHVRRPVELYEAPLAASPMLLGLSRPRIVLPSAALPREDLQYTFLHELIHHRRRDPAYKWLVQLTVCLYWFHPLVWLMAREIARDCELACDEAVLQTLGPEHRRAYGGTLLRALARSGPYPGSPGATALGEDARSLKERLTAIMKYKKQSKLTVLLSLALTAVLVTGTAAGAYTGPAKQSPAPSRAAGAGIADLPARREGVFAQAASAVEDRYEDGDIAGFSMLFYLLGKEEQTAWLERCYTDGQVSFFNVCLSELEEGEPPLVEAYAQRAYEDRRVSFLSVASQYMDDDALEDWIDRASQDRGQAAFLAALLDEAGRDDEKDALEDRLAKESEAKRLAEYQAHGVTKEGKHYYHNGRLVRIFLDQQPNSAFYTLNIEPAGGVDIKIVRDAGGRITGVAYMTAAEAEALFGDMEGPDEGPEDGPDGLADGGITVPVGIKRLQAGGYHWLGTYTLSPGDEIRYDVSAGTGEGLTVGFADMAHSPEEVAYLSVANQRADGALRCTAGITVDGRYVEPGRYRLFVHAADGGLGDVTGSVTIFLREHPLVQPR